MHPFVHALHFLGSYFCRARSDLSLLCSSAEVALLTETYMVPMRKLGLASFWYEAVIKVVLGFAEPQSLLIDLV